ncbi:MAG: hypothetical protein ACOY41_12620 [Pseudomonadota bacterium]
MVGARPGEPGTPALAKKGPGPRLLILASLLAFLAAPPALAAGERPRPESYANYSLYIQALVDYQRAQEAALKESPKGKSGASKLCRDDQGEQGASEKKKNSCEGKYLLAEDILPDEYERKRAEEDLDTNSSEDAYDSGQGAQAGTGDASGAGASDGYSTGSDDGYGSGSGSESGDGSASGIGSGTASGTASGTGYGSGFGTGAGGYESVEEVIARAGYGPTGSASIGPPEQRPMFNGIPLPELPVQDLSDAGIEGLLGMFDNARLKGLSDSGGSGSVVGLGSGYGASSGIVRGTLDGSDGSLLALLDSYQIAFLQPGFINMSAFTLYAEGYSLVHTSVSSSGNDSVDIALSAESRLHLWIVDRDGLPGSRFDEAGAIDINHLGVLVPRLELNIQGVRATDGSSLMQIEAVSPQPIYVDLANTSIGIADAVRDGSRVGPPTGVMTFGPQSLLTVAAGTSLNLQIGEPNSLSTPFVTMNGSIGNISVTDISLHDHNSGGKIRIGRFGLQGLTLVDAKMFLDDSTVVIDAGRGITSLGFDIERLYLGNDASGSIVGDFYARGGHLNSLRMTATPH